MLMYYIEPNCTDRATLVAEPGCSPVHIKMTKDDDDFQLYPCFNGLPSESLEDYTLEVEPLVAGSKDDEKKAECRCVFSSFFFCKTKERDKRVPSPGDIVFFDERLVPYMVYFTGYGSHKDQFRVVRFFENHHTRENGGWECRECCRLEVIDALLCTDNVTAIAPDSFRIHRGTHCVWDLDPGCRVRLRVGLAMTQVLIHHHDFYAFTLWDKWEL